MDVYCPKCSEPWDRENLNIISVECEDCDGKGYTTGRRLFVSDEIPEEAYTCLQRGDDDGTCDECHEVIEASCYGTGVVILDGSMTCEDCAIRTGLLTRKKPCVECSGSGQVEHGGDALEPDEVRDFLAGKGCPCCNWGAGVSCYDCDGKGNHPATFHDAAMLPVVSKDFPLRCGVVTLRNGSRECGRDAVMFDPGVQSYCREHGHYLVASWTDCERCKGTGLVAPVADERAQATAAGLQILGDDLDALASMVSE